MPWIDVTERMPDEYDTVLIGRAGVPWPITGFWTGEKWVNRDVREEALDPTHWMPLPPGPNAKIQGPERSDGPTGMEG